uniref:Uncharacterized protein n=1 Tax=Fagus sylvatica TaxID=28930 RepID=A0A2N9HQ89_FAGSY
MVAALVPGEVTSTVAAVVPGEATSTVAALVPGEATSTVAALVPGEATSTVEAVVPGEATSTVVALVPSEREAEKQWRRERENGRNEFGGPSNGVKLKPTASTAPMEPSRVAPLLSATTIAGPRHWQGGPQNRLQPSSLIHSAAPHLTPHPHLSLTSYSTAASQQQPCDPC